MLSGKNSQLTVQTMEMDAVVVGAGFSGLYMLHSLREAGYSVRAFETGDGVGGVWYWNRYPGARCDTESVYYNYTFSDELFQEWTWSSRYPAQPEILRYLNYVADKFDLRSDIQFKTRITGAHYNEAVERWDVYTDNGEKISAKYFISGVGCLSASNLPRIKGIESFEGDWYHTGNWPHEKVDFTGKKVGVIGTGSSGVQSIPEIANEADLLTVFQRTPQYSAPANNYQYSTEQMDEIKKNFQQLRTQMRESLFGMPIEPRNHSAMEDTNEQRQKVYEDAWQKGGFYLANTYNDLLTNENSNHTMAQFFRSKIVKIIEKPTIAEKLLPTYYYGTKRPILDTNYYETYNRENVTLIDVKKSPILEITPKGIKTSDGEYELDILVFATGYDGMTGPLFKMDIRGKGGEALKEKWANGTETRTYLGLTTAGFPNFFMITGPESPSVLSNMPVCIEQHVEWIIECIQYLDNHGIDVIDAKVEAEEAWSKHCREVAESTLFMKTDSWYTGANIEGKPCRFLIYLGGVGPYRKICDGVAEKGYEGFTLQSSKNASISPN
ncbi:MULTISPECIES: NAD(P)/FAD-dependent oxidoreductase [unclassified Bacillus (in: firmicutes)]|uniref:flavin-containing monooxygenase n=1 Tax=unclassified Bacillus (in: firmicutes) TaxID=185979 RepID=UPI001BE971F7|nr:MULTISPECIES: NAD(P)/FAD-dependent oxidoreductase [unclassified Bacillus (in: firmicutes)]MBT2617252.1 NAD(P)/FAD-dependent oxidoreductase [Bacillus sp. ISL-78]MBT2627813.1 NAD(P)/FAD-dependent oxidoreductase [Bacillus sp. ISL-101]